MPNVLLTVAYDGTNYGGFQLQQNAPTIAGELNAALSRLFGEEVRVRGASRTDAGVHALAQRALFTPPQGLLKIPEDRLPRVINGFLPEDIAVSNAALTGDERFHVVTSARRKTYIYRIDNGQTPNPLNARFCAYVPMALDTAAMSAAAAAFVGRRDFAACMASGGTVKTTVREIYELTVAQKLDNIIEITATGNGFLYNQARIIAGTLISAGLGRIEPASVAARLASRNRAQMGATAPAKGLTLVNIEY